MSLANSQVLHVSKILEAHWLKIAALGGYPVVKLLDFSNLVTLCLTLLLTDTLFSETTLFCMGSV